MADEMIDIYNENNIHSGIQMMKSIAHEKGLWHRTAHIWIYNSNGEILLQLRAKDKDLYPNMWDISVAGHVTAGEKPIISGLREIKEEIGLEINPDDLIFWKILKRKANYKEIKDREFSYIYFLEYNEDTSKLKLQKEEVAETKFLSIEKIEKELEKDSEKYTPHGEYWNKIIYEIKKLLENSK